MSLSDDLYSGRWIDGNGLVCPNQVSPGTQRGSDNGPLFTSQYLMIQNLLGDPLDTKAVAAIKACIDSQGYLHRAPGDVTQDAPDDHYGVLSANVLFKWGWSIKLHDNCWQPALLYLDSWWFASFSPIVAGIIAASNLTGTNTSNELLTWCLIQGTHRDPLCCVAGKTWLARKNVPAIFESYFPANHPFNTYVPLLKY